MPGARQAAQMVNGRWWFLKNSVNSGPSNQPVNGRWWFLKSYSSQASSNSVAHSRYVNEKLCLAKNAKIFV